jgi:hypothetical protein
MSLSPKKLLFRALGVVALNLVVVVAGTAWARNGVDRLEAAPVAAAVGARAEQLSGLVHRLTIDDRVAGVVIESLSLELDGGGAVTLHGTLASGLETGARIQVTGRRNGRALFVSDVRHLAPPPAPAAQKSATRRTVRGKLALLHADHFNEGRSQFIFEVHDAAGAITTLEIPAIPPALQGGMEVEVQGRAAGDAIVPDVVIVLALPPVTPKKVIGKAVQTNDALVILMRFTNSPGAPFSQADVRSVFAAGYSVCACRCRPHRSASKAEPSIAWRTRSAAVARRGMQRGNSALTYRHSHSGSGFSTRPFVAMTCA